MRLLVRALLCCVLATGAWAQRGGGGRGGGFGHGGGFGGAGFAHGGGGFGHGGGFAGSGFGRGFGGGFGHGFGSGFGHGFGNGFGHGFGFGNGFGRFGHGFNRFSFGVGFGGWPWWGGGWGWGGWGGPAWGYADPFYADPYYYAYPYTSSYYPYSSNPNVTVIYPQSTAPAAVYQQPAHPVIHEYRDEYGQSHEINYLIAFHDGVIRAALAYWVDGNNLHYVTRDHQEHTVPLSTVDRDYSERLNRDQRVQFHLP